MKHYFSKLLCVATIALLSMNMLWSHTAYAGEPVRHNITLSDGVVLETYLHRPIQQIRDVPAVIVLHGFNGSASVISDTGMLLTLNGYAALTISMRGWGESGGVDDCGALQGRDLVELADWLSSLEGIDARRIGAMGFSQGGQVALLGASFTDRISSTVAFFPVTDVLRWGRTTRNESVRSYVDSVCTRDSQVRSPLAVAADIMAPTLLVHGGRDGRVPTEQSLLMQQALNSAGRDSRLQIIPGAGHIFEADNWQASWPIAMEHLDNTLRDGEPLLAEVRSAQSVLGLSGDLTSYAIALSNYPILTVASSSAGPVSLYTISPSCVSCGIELIEDVRKSRVRENFVISMVPEIDADLDTISYLFCGAPSEIMENIVQYFDAVSRSDFSRGSSSEAQIAENYSTLAQRVAGLDTETQQQCLENSEFRANTATGFTTEFGMNQRVDAEPMLNPDTNREQLVFFAIDGGTGNGPRAEYLSPNELRALNDEIEQGLREVERLNRRVKALDTAIFLAEGVDIFVGLTIGYYAGPVGSSVYSGARSATYAAMGKSEEALLSSVGVVTPFAGTVGEGVDVAIDILTLTQSASEMIND